MASDLTLIVVEDNELLREEMVSFLSRHGWHVHGVDCGEMLNEWLAHHVPHVAILDVNLPYEDGYSIANRLRDTFPEMGIILLTARVRHVDRSAGYRAGADIYLTKPTDTTELIAVVENLGRRVVRHMPARYALNKQSQILTSPHGVQCQLTGSEVHLIETLLMSPERRAHKEFLVDQLSLKLAKPLTHETLTVMVSRLRSKCKQSLNIDNVLIADRGVGYRLTIPIAFN